MGLERGERGVEKEIKRERGREGGREGRDREEKPFSDQNSEVFKTVSRLISKHFPDYQWF